VQKKRIGLEECLKWYSTYVVSRRLSSNPGPPEKNSYTHHLHCTNNILLTFGNIVHLWDGSYLIAIFIESILRSDAVIVLIGRS
jgi:hypothetical protein